MQYRVDYSPEFQRDLDDIWNYIVTEYQNADAAERITNGIVDATEFLFTFPLSGQPVFLPGGMDSGYRILVFEAYVIVYRVLHGAVQVSRAVHSSVDYMRIMFPRLYHTGYIEDED
ncbi:MAG: type II toxin-antitoxin system RelE/ParE family toxin [Clostridia bacterium]|nr:type II toxin-antitoxin system RelE/ParE family toxin [Clostridia bacterium]